MISTEKSIFDAKISEVQTLRTFNGNRTINRLHVKHIAEQMENDLKFFPPITVNRTTGYIIDGQHRLEAFKMLVNSGRIPEDSTISIMYVDCDPVNERALTINANVNSKKWQLNDYILSYAAINEQYANLHQWCAEHPLMYENKHTPDAKKTKGGYRYRFAAALIKGKTCQKELIDGTFSATDEEYAIAEELYGQIDGIFRILGNGKPSALEKVATLWHKLHDLHPFETWIKMFKKKKDTLLKLPRDNGKEWEILFNKVHTLISTEEAYKTAA